MIRRVVLEATVLMVALTSTNAFLRPLPFVSITESTYSTTGMDNTALFMARPRKAKRMEEQKTNKGRLLEAIEESEGMESALAQKKKGKKKTNTKDGTIEDAAEAARQARLEEAQQRMDARPEVSAMIVDEESGMEVLAQGQNVMDVITRKAVRLSNLGPEYRLAQMFPGVPPHVRETYRLDWKTAEVPQMIEALRQACSVKLEDGSIGIPPPPSVTNKALDFVLANRDLLGYRMKRTLGRITMRSASEGKTEEATANQQLWQNFLTIENHLSAPFRQMMMDAEGRVGPNFGNLDLLSYCQGALYERVANYLVLKGMVAHWEKKVVDADMVQKNTETETNYITSISRGDPRRYLPDPPILFTLKECTQVCYMAQQMTKAFVETPELFNDLPPEVRFLEAALTIKGATPLRQFVIDEFCPAEGITPQGLREGLRRLMTQLENMQLDPYGDIVNILGRLIKAMEAGTEDERDPYALYLANQDSNGPGRFQTYTFNHAKLSLVRFFDSQYEGGNVVEVPPMKEENNPFGNLFNFGKDDTLKEPLRSEPVVEENNQPYKVPQARSMGRPHDVGWLEKLQEFYKKDELHMGKIPPGKIIADE